MMNFKTPQILTFLLAFLWCISSFSQNEVLPSNITWGSQTGSCADRLVDTGGSTGDYSNNESFLYTVCAEDEFLELNLEMVEFNLAAGDTLRLYTVQGALYNPGGTLNLIGTYTGNSIDWSNLKLNPGQCLTLDFTSDSNGVSSGWVFNHFCTVPNSCQDITAQFDSSIPSPNADNIIRVCTGEDITLNGSGQFSDNGSGASYEWDLGDGRTLNGQSITYNYDTPGIYVVNLNIRDNNTSIFPDGCPSTNQINQIIQVATIPDFTGTESSSIDICLGNTVEFTGVVTPTTSENVCTPPVSGVTYLPDPTEEQVNSGNLPKYSSCITVECFDDTQTLVNASDLVNICINMEHSYAGDIAMRLIAPNGNEVLLFNQGGNDTYIGNPIDNDDTQNPGTGLTYCFTVDATTLLENANTQSGGTNPPYRTFVPGDYRPIGSFDNLIGTTLNGDWCLEIVDNLYQDNGFIFEWSLAFDPSIVPEGFSFTPVIVSESWDPSPDIISQADGIATIQPSAEGTNCYTYRIVDDFGCEYTQEVCVNVTANPPPVVDAVLISTPFADNNIVEVRVTGPGNYEYSVDGGPFQDSNRFTGLTPGDHLFLARDTDGCGEGSAIISILDFPRFFTPNGDGRNDTWNISGLRNQPNAIISIYDRYGKLLKQISPTGQGWNGTFNGYPLPSTDYWFTLEYTDSSNGQRKLFKSHFALRR